MKYSGIDGGDKSNSNGFSNDPRGEVSLGHVLVSTMLPEVGFNLITSKARCNLICAHKFSIAQSVQVPKSQLNDLGEGNSTRRNTLYSCTKTRPKLKFAIGEWIT